MNNFIKIGCTCRVHIASDDTHYSFCWLISKKNREMTLLKIFSKIPVISANNKILQASMFVAKYHIGNQQQYYEN